MSLPTRRHFCLAAAGTIAVGATGRAAATDLPAVRALTKGPRFHWFGYYDKLQFDPTSRFALTMQVDFEGRSPKADDVIVVGMIDTHDKDKFIPLGRSSAWNWQQGCMLQWLPGSKSKVLWNDRDGDRYVCRIVDVNTREEQVVPFPVYAVSPDGKSAVSPDFRRLADTRPGYGYNGQPDPFADVDTPKEAGIWRTDLTTGKTELILPTAAIAALGPDEPSRRGTKHWVNHLLFNPTGTRFVFLNRWKAGRGWQTRMVTADPDGKNMRVLDDNGTTSHFIWRDANHILAWSKQPSHGGRFYLFADAPNGAVTVVGPDAMTEDGHCSYLPGNEWILCDTYPDKARRQNVYLFHVKSGRRVPLGHFESPKGYAGEWRCDTHPRFSPDGKSVVIDSPHAGGRQQYLIDVGPIVGG